MVRKDESISIFNIATMYIGALIGAGFASGQEIFMFFVSFDKEGFLGLFVVTVLFIFFGYIIMNLAKKLETETYEKVIVPFNIKALTIVVDFIVVFFLFGAFTAMIAAGGSIFDQQFGMPKIAGSLLMAVVVAVTVILGINRIKKVLGIVVPLVLILAVTVCILSLLLLEPEVHTIVKAVNNPFMDNWLMSSILYLSYNMLIVVGVLSPIGAKIKENRKALMGAGLGGAGFGIAAIIAYFAMFRYIGIHKEVELPMVYLAAQISPVIGMIYAIALLFGVYSAATSCLFGFSNRVLRFSSIKHYDNKVTIVIVTMVALFSSLVGFSNLISYLYPFMGYIGIIILANIVINVIKFRIFKR